MTTATAPDSAAMVLRPGLLVSMQTSIKGNIHYRTNSLEGTYVTETGEQRARWETERIVTDPDEHDLAIRTRTKVRGLITKVCALSAFGLLCPEDRAGELFGAMRQAREMTDAFNAEAKLTRMNVNVIYGRIAQDDVEAARAISAEVRSLMEDMTEGLQRLDVKAIRDAANKARAVGQMLSPEAQGRLEVAIEAARKSARQIVKAGEQAAVEVDRTAIAKIDLARTAFIDLDDAGAVVVPDPGAQRAIDFDPADKPATVTAPTREMEI